MIRQSYDEGIVLLAKKFIEEQKAFDENQKTMDMYRVLTEKAADRKEEVAKQLLKTVGSNNPERHIFIDGKLVTVYHQSSVVKMKDVLIG